MNTRRLVMILVTVAALATVGMVTYQQLFAAQTDDSAPTSAQTAVDTAPDIIQAEGVVVPLRDVTLSFAGSGQVAEILVEKGDVVAVSDPLMRLDAIDQEIAVTQAAASLAQAQANLQAAAAGLSTAQTGLALAETAVAIAEIDLAELTADPTPEEIAVRESSIALAEASTAQANGQRNLLFEGATASQMRTAEARLLAAEAQIRPISDVLGTFLGYEIDDAETEEMLRLQMNAAQANVNAAQAALEALNEGASAAELQAANGAVAAAMAQREAAQAQLNLLLTGPKSERLVVAETAVAQAEGQAAEASLAVTQAETAVTQAEAAVAQAELALATAQKALEQRTLTAPFAGAIADLSVELGETAIAGTPVVTLADFGGWLLETTDLNELDVVNISDDTEVEVTLDAIPGETINGTITQIAATSGTNRGDVTYRATVMLADRPDLPLRWGMTGLVSIRPK